MIKTKIKPRPDKAQKIAGIIIITLALLIVARHAFGSFEEKKYINRELYNTIINNEPEQCINPASDTTEGVIPVSYEGANFVKSKAEIEAEKKAKEIQEAEKLKKEQAKKIQIATTKSSYSKNELIEIIRQSANRHGVSSNLMIALAKAESGLNANAYNKNYNGTYDSGLYQFNSIHKFGLENTKNPVWSANKAAEWIKAGKIKAWVAYNNGSYKKFL